MRRFVAIAVIWTGCAMAWMFLGSTIVYRSGEKSASLRDEVERLWGAPILQSPPSAVFKIEVAGTDDVMPPEPADLKASQIDVGLDLEHRKKGLLWFATYAVEFAARYTFENDTDEAHELEVRFPLAGTNLIYDAFSIVDEESQPVDVDLEADGAVWRAMMSPGEERTFTVFYKSRGIESWHYGAPTNTTKINRFKLDLVVDSEQIDFPAGTISPSTHAFDGTRWHGKWAFDSLVSSAPIGVELPRKVNPGPLAKKITFFAPVSLLFFFFVVTILAAARRKNIHPMNYFFLGCAFFAFHLLFAYLVDHVALLPSFALSALVSVLLVTSYARLFVGWRFALFEIGGAQMIYLVLFSFTFFWTGFTGLAVTIGAVITLFVIMQITGRLRWSDTFAAMRPQPPQEATG